MSVQCIIMQFVMAIWHKIHIILLLVKDTLKYKEVLA